MITFTRHSFDKSTNKFFENIDVNDRWFILKSQFKSADPVIIRGSTAKKLKTKTNENVIIYNFAITLRHKNAEPICELDLYAINILYVDSYTKIVKLQSIRYYTMYNQRSFDDIKGDVLFLDHLKSSLSSRELDPLFPYAFIK
jgi:hypothetical protein